MLIVKAERKVRKEKKERDKRRREGERNEREWSMSDGVDILRI